MRRMRDMRSRSTRTGRFIQDRRHEPMRRDYRMREEPRRYERERFDDYDRDYGYSRDYGYDEDCYLSEDDLIEWSKDLLREVPEQDKALFSKENVERKAQELGIEYKDFNFAELYTTSLMLYTDYRKTLGSGSIDLYVRLAKDFLCDDDIDLDGGEKLCAYYEEIVCAK